MWYVFKGSLWSSTYGRCVLVYLVKKEETYSRESWKWLFWAATGLYGRAWSCCGQKKIEGLWNACLHQLNWRHTSKPGLWKQIDKAKGNRQKLWKTPFFLLLFKFFSKTDNENSFIIYFPDVVQNAHNSPFSVNTKHAFHMLFLLLLSSFINYSLI